MILHLDPSEPIQCIIHTITWLLETEVLARLLSTMLDRIQLSWRGESLLHLLTDIHVLKKNCE